MTNPTKAGTAGVTPLRLTFTPGRRGGVRGTEMPLPEILYGLAGAEERAQHERLVQARRETADELRQLEASLPDVKGADTIRTRQAIKRGAGKLPEPKAPAVEVSIAALRERLDNLDAVLVEASGELLESIPEARVAAAWQQAREDELAVLAGLPERVREVIAELDRAAGLRAQRGWITGLLATRSATPFVSAGGAPRNREETAAASELRLAAERLENVVAGVEQAGLGLEGASWIMAPQFATNLGSATLESEATS